LNALVNAFDKLHIVRGENSSYCGSKYSRWTVGQQTPWHFQLPFDECRMEDQLGPFAAICVCRQCSTWALQGFEVPLDSVHSNGKIAYRIGIINALSVCKVLLY